MPSSSSHTKIIDELSEMVFNDISNNLVVDNIVDEPTSIPTQSLPPPLFTFHSNMRNIYISP
ncbi:6827_t:CDS:2, partial [Diversispora eburnea]